MRVYIPGINYNKIELKNVMSYQIQNIYEKIIFSEEGIYKIRSKRKEEHLYKLNIKDGEIIHYQNKNNDLYPIFLVDNSEIFLHKEEFKLPVNFHICNSEKQVFKMNHKSNVSLHILTENNRIDEIYFDISNIDKLNEFAINEINSFLSLLN